MKKKKMFLHKPVDTKSTSGVEKCYVCGAIRHPHFTYGWYPWKLNHKSEPYCKGGVS